jgi:hypothetical protein
MVISIVAFLMIFFFRKTALILGGPGPAKQVAFFPSETPELLLRSVAGKIAALQEQAQMEQESASGAEKIYAGV